MNNLFGPKYENNIRAFFRNASEMDIRLDDFYLQGGIHPIKTKPNPDFTDHWLWKRITEEQSK